jgi:hypothetical protein
MRIVISLWLILLATRPLLAYTATEISDMVAPYAQAQKLLERKTIRVKDSGNVNLAFADLRKAFLRTSLLEDVQSAYEDMLPEGEDAEFEIMRVSENEYTYENKKGQQSRIQEILRSERKDGGIDLILFTSGDRFFGYYESLIVIQARPETEMTSIYNVDVFAYPENGFSRFFARHLKLVERFFDSKSDEIIELTVEIGKILCTEKA